MAGDPLRILIVDDSRIFRGVLEIALSGHSDLRVVGSVWSGEKAIEFVQQSPPDLVTLDVNMPGCGGLDALSAIQQFNAGRPDQPPVGVILVSALTKRGAAVTVEGLQRGAFDFIPKPEGPDERVNALTLQQQLLEKIQLFAQRRRRPIHSVLSPTYAPAHAQVHAPAPVHAPALPQRSQIARPTGRYHAVVIGSSTGGPEALTHLLPALTKNATVPVFIVQHLPTGMTGYFAASLARKCDYRVIEATDGDLVVPRTVYVAPGGRHLLVRRQQQDQVITTLTDQPPENACRPSVDVLFRSAAVAYERALVAVILTGMGIDGSVGLRALKRSGAYVIAQDEASSVVWGMPGAAVSTNQVDEILPLNQIAPAITRLIGGSVA